MVTLSKRISSDIKGNTSDCRSICDLKTQQAHESQTQPVTIAIIDSGIDKTKSDLAKYLIKDIGFIVHNGYIAEDENMEVKSEHGTAIAMIIRHLCKNVQFISVNILNERLVTDGRVLICAFEETLKLKPDIIHLSLGTTKWLYKFPLKKLVKAAVKNNIIVVSAANNQGLKSYPAYLKGVFGVKAAPVREHEIFYQKDGFFFACPSTEGIPGVEELTCQVMCGSSFSAAYITGQITRIKACEGISGIEDILTRMKSMGINTNSK